MSRVTLTADDFGLSESVNEAVEQAHRDGVLTSASLMVAAPAAEDAIARARRLPTLKVGLHLVVIDVLNALSEAHDCFAAEHDCSFHGRVRPCRYSG